MNCEHSIPENRAFVENNFIFKKDAGPEAPPSDPASFFFQKASGRKFAGAMSAFAR
jgi:hypothetical protein